MCSNQASGPRLARRGCSASPVSCKTPGGGNRASWPRERCPPRATGRRAIARAWQTLTGDAGWAGVLAEAFLADPRRTALLVFRPGMDLLPLFVEAIALLPPERRWDVEFSTYFSTLPAGVNCSWRGLIEGSSDAEAALKHPGALVINLCRPVGKAEGRALVNQARTGERLEARIVSGDASSGPPHARGSPPAARTQPLPPSRPSGGGLDAAAPPGPPAARPPVLRGVFRNPARVWVLVTAIAATCAAVLLAAVFFLLAPPRAIPTAEYAPPQTPNVETKTPSPEIKPKTPELAAATKPADATVREPVTAGETKEGAQKDDQETRAQIAGSGVPVNAVPLKPAPSSTEASKAHAASSPPEPVVNRNAVLSFDLGNSAKDAPARWALELEPYAQAGDVVSALELIRLNKPAKDSDKLPHSAADPTDEKTLDVMISDRAGLLREEQPLAHFKADGLKINFNWDPDATSDRVEQSKNSLGECILKIVIRNREPLYALLKERPIDRKDPVSIREPVAARVRASRKEAPKVDAVWDQSKNHKFDYLYAKIIVSKIKVRSKKSGHELRLVESDNPGEWICKGKTGRIIMTTVIRESDSKLRFTFSQNAWQAESRLTAMDRSLSVNPEAAVPAQKDGDSKADALKKQRTELEDDVRLLKDLIDAEFSFVLGLQVEDQKVLELVRIGDFATEKNP